MEVRFCDEGPVRDSRNRLRKITSPGLCHSQSRRSAVLWEIVVEGVGGKEKRGERRWSGAGEWPSCQMNLPCLLSKGLRGPTFNCSI